MSNFQSSLLFVFEHEGFYSNKKADKGGATQYGISTRFLKKAGLDIDGDGHVTSKDVKSIDKGKAAEIYKKYFWDHYKLDNIRAERIARKCFDMFVNMRGKVAASAIQKAVKSRGEKIKVDGILGPKSFRAIANCNRFHSTMLELLNALRVEQANVYETIIKADPTQEQFRKGWMRRAAR